MSERETLIPFLVGAVIFGVMGFAFGLLVCKLQLSILLVAVIVLLLALVFLLKTREALSYAVITVGFVIGTCVFYFLKSLFGIGILGLSVMVSFLIGNNIVSKEKDYSKAEIRRSIALSVMAVFFVLLSVGNGINATGILKDTLTNYWKIVTVVVGFYFGGRSAEKIVEAILLSKEKSDKNKQANN
ncbi:hypothetical protein [Archaeoglobus sp.]